MYPSDGKIQIQLSQNGKKTNFMDLNLESINELIKYLKYVKEGFKTRDNRNDPPNYGM